MKTSLYKNIMPADVDKKTNLVGTDHRDDEMLIKSPAGQSLASIYPLSPTEIEKYIYYSVDDRQRLLNQLTIALRDFYVHLNRKKAIYGFDPLRALDLLRLKIDQLSDAVFHETVVEIISRIRDRHVMIYARAPYGTSAVLPFTIEECWIEESQMYVVTKIDTTFRPKGLQRGARVTHWNGIPIARYIRLNANLFDGGNEAASLARSLAFLTHRSLRQFGPPLEQWVDLRYCIDGKEEEERFIWSGFDPLDVPSYPSVGRNFTGFGGDLQLMELQHSRRVRLAPDTFDNHHLSNKLKSSSLGVPIIEGHGANGVFDYGRVMTKDGVFAYLRFWSFRANDVDDLVNALAPILDTLPRTGLIFDIRGNTGGYIAAGERLLQLFNSQPIMPARLQFRVTDATRAMAQMSEEFIRWRSSFIEAFNTGEEYTRGIPIEGDDASYNQVGQKYMGPIILVSDALAFSTADIFCAGFIDNGIGKVICTDANMAAAGGNNWAWDVVRLYNPDFKLNSSLKPDIESGQLTEDIFSAFNSAGVSLSAKASIISSRSEYGGTAWSLQDGSLTHLIRSLPWMGPDMEVYLARGKSGLSEMPDDITFSVTMRRSLRVKANEGRILEDVGIIPDIIYHMTLRDVMENNQDLFERAGKELVYPIPSARDD